MKSQTYPLIHLLLAGAWGLGLLLLGASRAEAMTRTVRSTADSGPDSLRETILASVAGDRIDFAVRGTIRLTSGPLSIGRDLTIAGPGGGLTVSGNHNSRIFVVEDATTASISGLTIANGFESLAGGILNAGTLTLDGCTIWYNQASSSGGGIYNVGTLAVNNSTLAGNSAASFGGAVFNFGVLTLNNCTLAHNSARLGGGVFNDHALTLTSCTVSGNIGGGIYGVEAQLNHTVSILNTIVAGNTTDEGQSPYPDVHGIVLSQGHNLIGEADGSSGWGDTDWTGWIGTALEPLLGAFGLNGGPSLTMMPRPTSQAIDHGSSLILDPPYGLTTDQRGFPRRIGSFVDIGAVEFDPSYFDLKAALPRSWQGVGHSFSLPDLTGGSLGSPHPVGLSAGNIAFLAQGEGSQPAVFLQALNGPVSLVANANTALPGGAGNFVSFLSGPSISGQNVAFSATGVAGQQGVYVLTPPNPIRVIADLTTPIPGGTGNFTSFTPPDWLTPPSPIISGENVAFVASGSDGQQGVYLKTPPNPIKMIADLNTAIPEGTGNFTGFPDEACALVGEAAAFVGDGANGQEGVYVKLPDDPIWKVADTSTPIPGSSDLFEAFWSVSYDGSMVAFAGQGPLWFGEGGGVTGVRGVYKTAPGGPPCKVADDQTEIPGGTGFFTGFSDVAIDAGAVAFLGWQSRPGYLGEPPAGIYTDLGGLLSKVVAVGDTLNGKVVANLSFGAFGFSRGQLAFTATFDDGSQGLMMSALCVDAPQVGPNFIVTTIDDHDDGVPGACDCTLREAINAANIDAISANHTITFAPGVTGVVALVLGELVIRTNVSINGPGANLLAVSGNHASRVFNLNGETVDISDLTIRDGLASGANSSGGGVFNGGTLSLTNCALLGNVCIGSNGPNGVPTDGAPGGAGMGGAVYNGGTLTLVKCTLAHNEAHGGGGGTPGYRNFRVGYRGGAGGQGLGGAVCNDGGLSVVSCTFSANRVSGGRGGNGGEGGQWDGDAGSGGDAEGAGLLNRSTCQLIHSTVTGGVAERGAGGLNEFVSGPPGTALGGGVRATVDTTYFYNTLLALNTLGTGGQTDNGPDVSGAVQSQGYDLIGVTDGSSGWVATDLSGTAAAPLNPLLGPLQNNGGATDTHALLRGSPAIDQGNGFGTASDQRGRARPFDYPAIPNATGGNGSDIGAYEVSPITLTVTNSDDSGPGSLRQAIVDASSADGDTVTFAANVTGTLTLTTGPLAIDKNKTVTIAGPGADLLAISGNDASRVFTLSGNTTLSGLTITRGLGGIFNRATLTLNGCVISSNSGWGIINNRTLLANDCVIFGNGGAAGGGLYNRTDAAVTNTTVSGNFGELGGGIYNQGSLRVANCTISDNDAITVGGIYNYVDGEVAATTVSFSSIIAGNRAGNFPDVAGAFVSSSYNLIGRADGSTGLDNGVNQNQAGSVGTPLLPLLAPLADYGGPTPSHALLPGSPALDRGHSGGLRRDQRGRARPYDFRSAVDAGGGDGSDIGALEWNPPALNIAQSGGKAVVFWAEDERLCQLEATTQLSGMSDWSADSTPVVTQNGFQTVTETADATRKLYRLAFSNTSPILTRSLVQDFETSTPADYTLSQLVAPAPPVVLSADAASSGRFLRLIHDGINDDVNAITFNQVAPGLWRSIQAEFDFRLRSTDSPADGFAFLLVPTAVYGTNGPGHTNPIAFEEPNLPGVFAIGFDVFPHSAPELVNDVSVHWNGTEQRNSRLDLGTVDLASGNFHRCKVVLTHVPGGAVAAVSITPNINLAPGASVRPIVTFVPGLNPFDSRIEFAGRTGALNMTVDLDNIDVLFTTGGVGY